MRDFIVIKDPKVAKLFADSTRREILHNLRSHEMTPFQLARVLDKNVSSISYHLNVLEKVDLVEMTRTAIKGNLVKKFYSSTAQKFIISYTLSEGLVPGSEEIAEWSEEVCKGAVQSLDIFGFKPREREEELLKIIEKYLTFRKMAYEEVISQQKKPVKVTRPALGLLLSLLRDIRLHQNPEYQRVLDEASGELKDMGLGG